MRAARCICQPCISEHVERGTLRIRSEQREWHALPCPALPCPAMISHCKSAKVNRTAKAYNNLEHCREQQEPSTGAAAAAAAALSFPFVNYACPKLRAVPAPRLLISLLLIVPPFYIILPPLTFASSGSRRNKFIYI
ncbi:uncharacterized protein DMAD_09966 [Drosophila madeirensis]|uniref:Uncharacterized protein n=1 Tax=Drosophila madeirensis TaxID=30013 RepID=A0AAU9EYV1_DROMD